MIVPVSHILHHQTTPALAKVETALDMIKEVSTNHSFARRAFAFFQGLLQCMHQSLGHPNPSDCTVVSDNQPLFFTMTPMPTSSTLGPESSPGVRTLYRYTKDIALDLQAQLESIEAGDFTESLWGFDDLV